MPENNVQNDRSISFKHFSLFRRVVAKKQTGTLAFITQLGFAGRIPFVQGQLAGHVVETQLRHFFTKPMQDAYWEEKTQDAAGSVPPATVLSNILESLDWDESFCHSLATMFGTLPAVRVENMPLQFDDYHVEICASLLYRQSLSSAKFRPADFLNGLTSLETLSVRLKVVLLAYVCALMNPVPRAKTQANVKKRRPSTGVSGVASRIFQRIKGIGS